MDKDCLFDKCDDYDKTIAVFCGMLGGIIDIVFVGEPETSKLVKWTDKVTDHMIVKFARLCKWKGKIGENEATRAIGWLEKNFKVNYDMAKSSDVNGAVNMGTRNHHLKSLGHSPDIIGLFFSILDQFQGTANFIDGGKLITVHTEANDLTIYGHTFPAKLFCGFVNWFNHLISDIGGSSYSRRKHGGRGSGLPLPFYNLLLFCDFGEIETKKGKETIAEIATDVFVKGYDVRFGLAMTIPVLITETLIKFTWVIKHRFYHKYTWKECIPSSVHGDLRCMLLIGNSTLCAFDAADAIAQGNVLGFATHINFVAWCRLLKLVFKEVCIRNKWGMAYLEIEFQIIDAQLDDYLSKLNQIDVEKVEYEITLIKSMNHELLSLTTEKEIAYKLYQLSTQFDLNLPFHNHKEFIDFMNEDEDLIL